jgi:O-antigen/teichoic acid export membrane protein
VNLKRFISHSLLYTISPQIPKIVGFFLLPLITPYLSVTDYGIYAIVVAIMAMFVPLTELGLPILLANVFIKHPYRWKTTWQQLHYYHLWWSGIMAVLQGLLIYTLLPAEATTQRLSIVLLSSLPVALFQTTTLLGFRYYQLVQRPLVPVLILTLSGSVLVALNWYLIVYEQLGYMAWLWSNLAAVACQFVGFIYPLYIKYRIVPIITYRLRFLVAQLKIALPTVPHFFSFFLINTADRLLMPFLGININAIGRYNVAYQMGSYFDITGNALGNVVTPIQLKGLATQDPKLYDFTKWLHINFIVVGFLAALWVKEIMIWCIRNEALQSSYPLAIFILMSYTYRPFYWLIANSLYYQQQTTQLLKISLVAGCLNLVLNIILIPLIGIWAAAIVTFVSMMYMAFSGFYWQPTLVKQKSPIPFLLLTILALLVAFLLKDIVLSIKLCLSVLIFGIWIYDWYKHRMV